MDDVTTGSDAAGEPVAGGATGPSSRRWLWVAVAAVILGAVVVAFAIFRPDKAFTDTVVNDSIPAEVQEAIGQASGSISAPSGGGSPAGGSQPAALGEGSFVGQDGHSAVGRAVVVELPDGGRQLVLEDLDVDNGPDLKLFLSPSADGNVDGGVNLAPLRGNKGTQIYELPASIDLTSLPNVVIWCERFSTPFGTATLQT